MFPRVIDVAVTPTSLAPPLPPGGALVVSPPPGPLVPLAFVPEPGPVPLVPVAEPPLSVPVPLRSPLADAPPPPTPPPVRSASATWPEFALDPQAAATRARAARATSRRS